MPEIAIRQALACLDHERLQKLTAKLVDIHSPTGHERTALQVLADYLGAAGLPAQLRPAGADSAVLRCEQAGRGDGLSLLLYSPIDTHLVASSDDLPWAGDSLRRDMLPRAEIHDDLVIGLGAANPKATVAIMAEALIAIHRSGVALRGDLILGVAGGGMPVSAAHTGFTGLGDGAYRLLSDGAVADFAIVIKPGSGVYHEEPGLCWFRISVRGKLGYAGLPHELNENPIGAAGRLIIALDPWLQAYTSANTAGQVVPRAAITAVRAGWTDRLAFTPAAAEIYLDVRCPPHLSPAAVKAQVVAAVREIEARDGSMKADVDMCGAYPSARTPPDSWIIQSAIRAWEAVEGKPHAPPPPIGGQTDISLLRNLQIPTARIGWRSTPPNAPDSLREGLGGMGVASTDEMMLVCRKVVHAAIETCMRER